MSDISVSTSEVGLFLTKFHRSRLQKKNKEYFGFETKCSHVGSYPLFSTDYNLYFLLKCFIIRELIVKADSGVYLFLKLLFGQIKCF